MVQSSHILTLTRVVYGARQACTVGDLWLCVGVALVRLLGRHVIVMLFDCRV